MRIPSSIVIACLLGGLFAATTSHATRAPRAREPVRLEIIDRDSGATLQPRRYRGDHWIAGVPGTPYAVGLRNTTGARVLVVLSVDGINAVSGETASPAQTGYVLAPWQTTEITGWRKSHADVARFEFAALDESYAARTGRPDHVGTIGIAVFGEREAPPPPVSVASAPVSAGTAQDRSAFESAADGRAQRQRIGTAHGAREWSPVSSTTFERATRRPMQVATLRYDSPDALVARGVIPQPSRWTPRRPNAFPGAFVPDP